MNIIPNYPSEHVKMIVQYPEDLHGSCPICKAPVSKKYNSSEKTIFTLKKAFDVRYDLFVCTNQGCSLSDTPFNPSPRFDYSQRSFGRDVLEKVGEYHLSITDKKRKFALNPGQILSILKKEYNLDISESTVARMCDDILILTSFHIDQNTAKIIHKQEFLLIALDGQEPDGDRPALWNFTDIISGRVLMTRYFETVDYHVLHKCIEDIKKLYQKPIIGFISDKQGPIRKCMETFYRDIPHQYCTYHFSTNLWNHLEKYGNKIIKELQKTVKSLYINTASVDTKIYDPSIGKKVSFKRLFAPLSKEILSNLKVKNEKYKQLKGIQGYENLSKYIIGFKQSLKLIPSDDRFGKHMKSTVENLEIALESTKNQFQNAKEGFNAFKKVHKLLWKDELDRIEKIQRLNKEFEYIWARSQEINPKFQLNERKSFLPTSKTPYWKILAEWTRLWESYKPGLFKYYKFPMPIKSNVEMEQKFGIEKHRFRSLSGRGHVGHMIHSRGQYVLRLQYCSAEEIDFDEIIGNPEEHFSFIHKKAELQVLNQELAENIHKSSQRGNYGYQISKTYLNLIQKIYGLYQTELEDELH